MTEKKNYSPGKVSEFFLHLMTYGGFDFKNGVIYMWGDPYLFIPINAFYYLQDKISSKLGRDGLDLLYWIGKVTGRNATNALIKKYGFNIKDLPMFVNGATQDGFGYFTIKEMHLDKKPLTALLTSKNCSVAEAFLKNKKKSKIPVDSYISGLIAGGSEPLVSTFVQSNEVKCRAKGDNECFFALKSMDSPESFPFMKKTTFNFGDLEKKSLKLYFSRKRPYSILGKKEFPADFGNGEFYLNKVKGGVIASYIMSIFYRTLNNLLSKKDYESLIDGFCKISVESIVSTFEKPNKQPDKIRILKQVLPSLDIFGFGSFSLKYLKENKIILENIDNAFPRDYIYLFGSSKGYEDIIPKYLLKHFLTIYLGKEIEIEEISCRGRKQKSCLFEVKISN